MGDIWELSGSGFGSGTSWNVKKNRTQYGTVQLPNYVASFPPEQLGLWWTGASIGGNEAPGQTVYINSRLVYPPVSATPAPIPGTIITPPVTGCTSGTTRQVPCQKDPNKLVTQECVSGTWVTTKVDEKKCAGEDPAKAIVVAVILVLVIIYLGSKA